MLLVKVNKWGGTFAELRFRDNGGGSLQH
uniref:Uncharacterized protein n=1 Tax=Anguilla anguilla TaxID=7936 RepID=A0A0E9VVS4_ANGAN